MRGHLFDPIPSVRSEQAEVPEDLDAAVMRMLAKRPEDRFATLEEAARAIELVGQDESLVRTHIIELARCGARQRPEIHVPVSPSPAVRKRPAASAASAATTVVSQPPRRRVTAIVVTLAIVLGAVGATAALRPDLLGIGTDVETTSDSLATAPAMTPPPAPDSTPREVVTAPDTTPVEVPVTKSAPIVNQPAENPPAAPSPTRPTGGRLRDALIARREQRAANQSAPASSPASSPVVTPPSASKVPDPAPVQAAEITPVVTAPPPPAPVTTGWVRIGSNAPLADIRIGDGEWTRLRELVWREVPAGTVKLSVRSESCRTWEGTYNVPAGDSIRIGYRPSICTPLP
jgi:serine/threonine-protein kinase